MTKTGRGRRVPPADGPPTNATKVGWGFNPGPTRTAPGREYRPTPELRSQVTPDADLDARTALSARPAGTRTLRIVRGLGVVDGRLVITRCRLPSLVRTSALTEPVPRVGH